MTSALFVEDARRISRTALSWEHLAGKSVLVTGANGALAAYFIEILLVLSACAPRPIRLTGMVRSLERAHKRFRHHQAAPDLDFIVGDVASASPLLRFDYIVHAASNASPRFYSTDPVGTIAANVDGTARLLEASRQGGSEGLLFLSSGEVYGQVQTVPTAEHDHGYVDPAAVRSCYAESKRLGEALCVAYHHQHGVPAFIARPFHTYGPTMALDDGRVYADFVADIVAGRDIVIKGDGLARRAFCYASDAVAGFLTVLLHGQAAIPYNVGNEDGEASIRELAEMLANLFPERGLGVRVEGRAPGGAYMVSPIARNCPDTRRLRALGWSPEIALGEGFRRTIQAFLEDGTTV